MKIISLIVENDNGEKEVIDVQDGIGVFINAKDSSEIVSYSSNEALQMKTIKNIMTRWL